MIANNIPINGCSISYNNIAAIGGLLNGICIIKCDSPKTLLPLNAGGLRQRHSRAKRKEKCKELFHFRIWFPET